MRFREVFLHEIGRGLRQATTWLYLGLLLGLTIVMAGSADPVLGTRFDAPVKLATFALALGIVGTLVTAALFVEAGHRDVRWRMESLFHTTPLRKQEYLGGRFLGALVVNGLLLLAIPIGLMVSTLLPEESIGALGAFRPEAYLLPYVIFLLPNLLVNAAVMFGITVLTRRSLPGYLGALGLLAAYMTTLNLTAGIEGARLAGLLDPTGGVAMSAMTEGWTRIEQNTRPIELTGVLLWNRLLWTVLAVGMLAFTWRRFGFGHAMAASGRTRSASAVPETATPDLSASGARAGRAAPLAVPSVIRSFGVRTRVRQTLAIARIAFRQTALSREFMLITIGLFAFAVFMGMESRHDPMFGTPLWPGTRFIVANLTGRFMSILIGVLIVLYAGELVWRERDARAHELGDTQPMPDWVALVGSFLAIGLVLVLLQVALMASGIVLQAVQGYALGIGVYVRALFGFKLADYLLFAVLALFVHILVNNKYVGHLVAVVVILAVFQASRFGIEHSMLIYASDPGWTYWDLSGFGRFTGPFVWFKLYWGAWALLLGTIALMFWVRGTERGMSARARLARRRIRSRTGAASAASLLLIVATGGFVFYNTNIRNDYRTTQDALALDAEYERRYKRFEVAAQPWLVGTKLHVELHPERLTLAVRGTYRLVNRTDVPIDSIHLTSLLFAEAVMRRIEFDRGAKVVVDDAELGYQIVALGSALQPGDSLRMEFEVDVAPRGFRHLGSGTANTSVMRNGTYLEMMRVLPHIGYQREHRELADPGNRREHGLGPRAYFRPIDDPRGLRSPRSSPTSDWIDFEATVGTALDQIAVLPGTLKRTWTEGGRRYFHYRSDAPIMNSIHLFSARYAVHQARWKDVEIRVLHHPDHTANLGRMVRAIEASLEYYSEQFGPYPHGHFWLIEIPGYRGNFGRAYPGGMIYTESNAIARARLGDDDTGENGEFMNTPMLFIAHEVAHQWWGHRMIAADVVGSQVLSETLAQYSSAMVLERAEGPRPARRFLRNMHGFYLDGRGSHATPEVPLMMSADHEYIHYRKGPVAMYALRDYLGEDRVNGALRRLMEKHAGQCPPYATTRDLYRELGSAVPDSLQQLVDDLFATITLWDLRATSARAEAMGTGEYRVTLEVEATKLRSDSLGSDTEVPMDDFVEIAVFAPAKEGQLVGEALYLDKHRIRSGRQTITVTVPAIPARAGIDPYHTLITRHRERLIEGKVVDVKIEGARGPADP